MYESSLFIPEGSNKMNILPCFIKRLVLLTLLYTTTGIAPLLAQSVPYIIGIVPQFEARKLHQTWKPIVDYLTIETGYQFKIEGSPKIPDFQNQFMRGEFDFVYMNPYHFVIASQQQHYIPLVKDVGKLLQGVLVVKKDSPITEIAQLNNSTIAFPAPNALGASLLMRQELHDLFKIDFYPRYVKTHDSVYLNVLLGETDAGGGVQNTLSRQPAEYQSALRVLHRTQQVQPHPFAVHPRVPQQVANQVKTALLKLGDSQSGQLLLSKIPMKKIGPATLDDYLPLKKLGLERFTVE
jgi:phosphonate transport system substrate-binding protein